MRVLPILTSFSAQRTQNIKNAGNNRVNFNGYSSDTVSFSGRVSKTLVKNIFDNYNPKEFLYSGFNVHNKHIGKKMKGFYTSDEFKKLFIFAEKKGVFDLNVNPKTHYITTSLIDPKENPLMSKLVWVTDSARYLPILKDKYPNAAVPLIENMSRFYAKQDKNFNRIINDPLLYELNRDWPNTAKNGVGHVFNPKNMTTHKWFAHTRLESTGLYLQAVSDLMLDGLSGAKYGYKGYDHPSDKTVNAIGNIVSYLKAVVYPYAKSTGSWEEVTFKITPSSDVAVINEGMRKVLNLMYSETSNPELIKLRGRIIGSKNGAVFKDENALRQLLSVGEYRIKTNSLEEVPDVRDFDGAMSFIPHTETFDKDILKDAKSIIVRMNSLSEKWNDKEEIFEQGISRENGVIRYVGDRYLNMTSGHQVNQGKLNKNTEAQWFMSSDISKSYGVAGKRLMDAIRDGKLDFNDEVKMVLNTAIRKQTEFINRAYGRITGENSFKANGEPCPAYQIPEAYQAVKKSNGEIVFVPGTHTPLGWAQSSLYDASKLMFENLTRFEKLQAI